MKTETMKKPSDSSSRKRHQALRITKKVKRQQTRALKNAIIRERKAGFLQAVESGDLEGVKSLYCPGILDEVGRNTQTALHAAAEVLRKHLMNYGSRAGHIITGLFRYGGLRHCISSLTVSI